MRAVAVAAVLTVGRRLVDDQNDGAAGVNVEVVQDFRHFQTLARFCVRHVCQMKRPSGASFAQRESTTTSRQKTFAPSLSLRAVRAETTMLANAFANEGLQTLLESDRCFRALALLLSLYETMSYLFVFVVRLRTQAER